MAEFEHDPERTLNKIVEIEKKFPVQQWRINGVEFWPFIRTSLAYTQRKIIKPKKAKSRVSIYKDLLKRYGKLIARVPFHVWQLKRKLKDAKRIFIGAATHRVLVNGIKVNRYFDVAISDFNKNNDTSLILDRGTSLNKSLYPNNEYWFSLPSVYIYYEFLRRLKIEKANPYRFELQGYEEFYNYLLENFENPGYLKANFNMKSIQRSMRVFHDRKEYLKRLFKESQVKSAYFLCYYSSLYYPLMAAFNELRIRTSDVQHGGMGKGHWSYDSWVNAPAGGYKLLPRFFWTWDSHSADLVNSWAVNTRFHKAIPMGTPWRNDYADQVGRLVARNGYILVIMTDVMVEDYILKTVQHLGAGKRWVFRMHPRMVRQRNILDQQLVDYGIAKLATVEDSTQVLLNDSILACSIFISNSSGSVIEAIQAGVTPIMLPSPGIKYYEQYIQSGQVKLLPEKKEETLVAFINEASSADKVQSGKIEQGVYDNRFVDYEAITAQA